MDPNNITQQLKDIGLSDKEINILQMFLNTPKASISDLQNQSNLPRTTVQRIVDHLVEKGLLTWVMQNQGKYVQITDFSKFLQKLQEKTQTLNKSIDTIRSLSKIYSESSLSKLSPKPAVKYYEGVEGIKQIIWNTLKSETLLKVYTNAMRQEIVGKDWMTSYCLEFVKRGIQDRVLCDRKYASNSYQRYGNRKKYFSPVVDFFQKSSERVLNSSVMKIQGETYLYDNILAMYTWEGNILVGFEIESSYITDTQNSIFDILWGMTSEKDSIDNYLK